MCICFSVPGAPTCCPRHSHSLLKQTFEIVSGVGGRVWDRERVGGSGIGSGWEGFGLGAGGRVWDPELVGGSGIGSWWEGLRSGAGGKV